MLIRKKRIPVTHMLFIGMLPSFLKKMVYRLMGYKIGKNVSLSLGSVIIGKKVSIGDNVKIAYLTIIRGKEITLGRFVRIGSLSVIDTGKIFIDEDARINEQVYIGGMKSPQSSFHLGKRAIVMQLSYINPTLPVYIGDDSGIGGHCLLFTHGSWNSQLEGFPVKFAPIHLGKKVWLPWRVFVMPGVNVGDNVVIGANSLISSDLPSNSFAAGSPAKVIRENVPLMPGESTQSEMLKNIFAEFFDYLTYEEVPSDIKNSGDNFIALIKGKKSGAVHYSQQWQNAEKGDRKSILVLRTGTEKALRDAMKSGFGMAVSVETNLRIGTNDAGEELLSFFSRYGVRFSRLD